MATPPEGKYSTSGKILKYCAYALMIVGMGLTMLGVSSLFMGTGFTFLDPVYMLLLGLLLLFAGIPLLAIAQQGIIKPEFENISLIKCTNLDCKYKIAKKFERGEYVFKELDKKCEKCDSPLIIAAIFEIDKTPSTKKLGERKKTGDLEKEEETEPEEELPKLKI